MSGGMAREAMSVIGQEGERRWPSGGSQRTSSQRCRARRWIARSSSGTGPQPGAFAMTEDDEKITFRMNPCGSGQRLWRMGRYEGENAHAVMEGEHDWAYGRKGFPIYCTHCSFMNEILPMQWI